MSDEMPNLSRSIDRLIERVYHLGARYAPLENAISSRHHISIWPPGTDY